MDCLQGRGAGKPTPNPFSGQRRPPFDVHHAPWIETGLGATRDLPRRDARTAHDSVGRALELANHIRHNGQPALANAVHAAASNAFFHGFSAACLVAAGVSAVAAIGALVLLPAHPTTGLTLALESE
jgi:hypothetical protein